uniref:Uncharacterized protein n=1 Tax=Aegilops tauschii subsp. strangulata TaxID=200361 RepID=A0A453I439_AEGTS
MIEQMDLIRCVAKICHPFMAKILPSYCRIDLTLFFASPSFMFPHKCWCTDHVNVSSRSSWQE